MIWIFTAVCLAAAVLGIRLFRLRRQLRSMAEQLDQRTKGLTGKGISVSLIDGDLNRLAASVNRSLKGQEKFRVEMRRSSLRLKDSIANLSHDLRTPLTSVLGYLQLARESGCPAEKREEYLQIVGGKANALKDMVNSLYELSVLEVQKPPLKREKLDLNLLTADVLAGQYGAFQKRGIALTVKLPDFPVQIVGDRVACTRILQNLLNNTERYAKGRAEISLEKYASRALLSIRNPAPDLTREDTAHLFERFYTPDPSRSRSGSGLGLSIVKTLLTQMGGQIGASLEEQTLCLTAGFPLSVENPEDP